MFNLQRFNNIYYSWNIIIIYTISLVHEIVVISGSVVQNKIDSNNILQQGTFNKYDIIIIVIIDV